MINFFSKIRFLLTNILPPTTIDLSDGTWNARKGLPYYEKIYLRNNVRTKTFIMNLTQKLALTYKDAIAIHNIKTKRI